MGYVVCKFQNFHNDPHNDLDDDQMICVDDSHPAWDQIYSDWKEGKNPTKSPLWKHGVFAHTKEIEKTS